jgi:hypothetical protein
VYCILLGGPRASALRFDWIGNEVWTPPFDGHDFPSPCLSHHDCGMGGRNHCETYKQKTQRMTNRRRELNPGLPCDGRKCPPLYFSGLAFWASAGIRSEFERAPLESRGRALGMRRTRPGAQPKEMDKFGFGTKSVCLRSGRDACSPCAHLTSQSCFRAWAERLAMQLYSQLQIKKDVKPEDAS